MGWLDNLWRRRQGRATDTPADMVAARKRQQKEEERATADELEEAAHEQRNEEIFREPRKPPLTG